MKPAKNKKQSQSSRNQLQPNEAQLQPIKILHFFRFGRLSIARILLGIFTFPIFLPVITSIGISTQYTYANENKEIGTLGSNWKAVQFQSPKSSFVISLNTSELIEDESQIHFEIMTNTSEKKSLGLEIEGNEVFAGKYFTSPTYFPQVNSLSLRCIGCEKYPNSTVSIVALDPTESYKSVSFSTDNFMETFTAKAAPSGFAVVPRSKWGADETLRYKTHPTWKKIFEQNEKIVPSEAALKAEAKNEQIEAHLRKEYPQEFITNEVIRSENGNDLVWPIEKTKYIRKITLHHTGESNTKNLTDEEIMRSMYYYHTIVRGWGDLGYQYVIGQRGIVYEGRAGGDYTVGAHASWNNRSSVGISVMGNFEVDSVVREQKTAIVSTIGYLAKKYGIDIGKKIVGHKACKVGEECATRDSETYSLMGHRDIGYTSCPGTNLYSLLTTDYQISLAADTKGLIYKANPVNKPRTVNPRATRVNSTRTINVSSRNTINTTTGSTSPVSGSAQPTQKSTTTIDSIEKISGPQGPKIRVKLSFPEKLSSVQLEGIGKTLTFQANTSKRKIASNSKISINPKDGQLEYELNGKKQLAKRVSLETDVVRIANWERIPSWDSSGTMNDNEFRGKIEVGLEKGKLLIINELPLEAYLRGLAEFSNGENKAKAETILVAARSYAYFYTQKSNRKFPGKPYDASDDPDVFQKYLGYGYEKRSPISVSYVKNTTGKIITYKGKPIKPWYFTQSDGKTLSAKEYCENRKNRQEIPANTQCENIPYLQSKDDPGSKGLTRKGHGVGISGAGASYLAKEKNMSTEQIIQYFLTGTKVKKQY